MKMMDFKAPHAAPLVAYADRVAAALGLTSGGVPYPDPAHGGTEAEVLFILSHPRSDALRERGGSGLLSLENDDFPSGNCFDHCRRIGLGFERMTPWNAVPQPLPEGRDPGRDDLRIGAGWLPGLVKLLAKLRVVVLLSRNAETAWADAVPHPALDPIRGPGPGRKGMANAGADQRLVDAFDEIAARLGLPTAGP